MYTVMTSRMFPLGAFDCSGNHVFPRDANKNDEYTCPDCFRPLIFVDAVERVKHFRHRAETIKCKYYNGPNESQIHKDAKHALKQILENKSSLKYSRRCIKFCEKFCITPPNICGDSIIKRNIDLNIMTHLELVMCHI